MFFFPATSKTIDNNIMAGGNNTTIHINNKPKPTPVVPGTETFWQKTWRKTEENPFIFPGI